MAARQGAGDDTRVLVAADRDAFRKLQGQAAGLDLVALDPGDAAQAVLEIRPRVFVWLDPDVATGLATVEALHQARPDVRVVYVTPRGAEAERLAALESGVDEVLAEPISRSELAARIRRLLRRSSRVRGTRLPIGEHLELDLDRRELLRDGHWVHLRPKEARPLGALRPGTRAGAHAASYPRTRLGSGP